MAGRFYVDWIQFKQSETEKAQIVSSDTSEGNYVITV